MAQGEERTVEDVLKAVPEAYAEKQSTTATAPGREATQPCCERKEASAITSGWRG